MHPVRHRRLFSDLAAARALASAAEGRILLRPAAGDPPDAWVVVFRCRSLSALGKCGPVFSDEHHVRLQCSAGYPAEQPFASMITPALHPHIWPNRTLCLGRWRPHEKLDSLIQRIGSMLCYDPAAINWRSVADDSTAVWASAHRSLFPLDPGFLSLLAAIGAHLDG